ncbi:MAG: hypothetical protein WC050_00885 [Candidatus Paceibacterota bacterium]
MTYFKNIWDQLRALYEARNEPESVQPLAELYWRLLLSLSVVCVFGIFAYGVSEFVGVLGNLSSASSASLNPPVSLDRKQLEALLAAFEARSSTTSTNIDPAALVDPSK